MDSTILAGVIGAGGATIGVVIAKDTKISEFRQQWVDGLRAEVSELISVAIAVLEARVLDKEKKDTRIYELTAKANMLAYRIRLRMDLRKKLAQTLIKEINELIEITDSGTASQKELGTCTLRVTFTTSQLLDDAWRKVKRGELRFQAVLLLAGLALISSIVWSLHPHWLHLAQSSKESSHACTVTVQANH